MIEDIPNVSSSVARGSNDGKHFIEKASKFFLKPGGVVLICLMLFGLTVWTFAPVLQTEFQVFDEAT